MNIQELYKLAQTEETKLITSEIHKSNDYYGHASILKKYAGLPNESPLKAIIEHGVTLNNFVSDNDTQSDLSTMLCFSDQRRAYLQTKVDKKIIAIGPLILYSDSYLSNNELISECKRLGKNLLVFPFHSTHHIHFDYDLNKFLNILDQLGKDFDTIRICMYWKDIIRGMAEKYYARGYECVTAGHMYDPLFLSRLRSIIETSSATASISTGIGTSLGYCISLNKPHILINAKDFNVKRTDLAQFKYPSPEHRKHKLLNQFFKTYSLLNDQITPQQHDLAEKYFGINCIKTPFELKSLLYGAEEMSQKNTIHMNRKNLMTKTKTRPETDKQTMINLKTATSKQDIDNYLIDGKLALQDGNIENAFHFLNKAKASKTPIMGLDYLRALCFCKMNQMAAACETLKEELRYFPENTEATSLFQEINSKKQNIQATNAFNDKEFCSILKFVRSYTMVGNERLYSLFSLAKKICIDDIPGNFVECGVAAGGSTALLAYVIKKYSKRSRTLYAFDSFEGMPEPTDEDRHKGVSADETGWGTGTCAAPEESVKEICKKLDVSGIVKTVKGYFQDTLPEMKNKIGNIAFLHMDGDWYESTKSILDNIYDNVVNNGVIQTDDYGHWDGCKKALHEFEASHKIRLNLNNIDGTGVWFRKPNQHNSDLKLLNLGCGNHYHRKWINVDFQSNGDGVIAHDLNKGIPYKNSSFDAVYHSHLLEHFSKQYAPTFIKECYRVLKPGGIIRVVVPDLEQITRLYLDSLDSALKGDTKAQQRYEWLMLELYDQTVREMPGGEMLEYWKQNPMPAESFVIERYGSEVLNFLQQFRMKNTANSDMYTPCTSTCKVDNLGERQSPQKIGEFRLSGEIHKWMYDRYSLSNLMHQAGFNNIRTCQATKSGIVNFNTYLLDVGKNGSVRKPDSLFMEALK